eukprot:jgi/Psemu1/48560/gm1.48560_g
MAPAKRRTRAKPKEDDDYDPNEESKMEVDQDPQDPDSDDEVVRMEEEENDKFVERIMRVMEKAISDPEKNSTMKRIIDREVRKRIRAIHEDATRNRKPDDDSSDKGENQQDDDSRGFNNGRLLIMSIETHDWEYQSGYTGTRQFTLFWS